MNSFNPPNNGNSSYTLSQPPLQPPQSHHQSHSSYPLSSVSSYSTLTSTSGSPEFPQAHYQQQQVRQLQHQLQMQQQQQLNNNQPIAMMQGPAAMNQSHSPSPMASAAVSVNVSQFAPSQPPLIYNSPSANSYFPQFTAHQFNAINSTMQQQHQQHQQQNHQPAAQQFYSPANFNHFLSPNKHANFHPATAHSHSHSVIPNPSALQSPHSFPSISIEFSPTPSNAEFAKIDNGGDYLNLRLAGNNSANAAGTGAGAGIVTGSAELPLFASENPSKEENSFKLQPNPNQSQASHSPPLNTNSADPKLSNPLIADPLNQFNFISPAIPVVVSSSLPLPSLAAAVKSPPPKKKRESYAKMKRLAMNKSSFLCEQCGITTFERYGSGRFCSSTCARTFSIAARYRELTEKRHAESAAAKANKNSLAAEFTNFNRNQTNPNLLSALANSFSHGFPTQQQTMLNGALLPSNSMSSWTPAAQQYQLQSNYLNAAASRNNSLIQSQFIQQSMQAQNQNQSQMQMQNLNQNQHQLQPHSYSNPVISSQPSLQPPQIPIPSAMQQFQIQQIINNNQMLNQQRIINLNNIQNNINNNNNNNNININNHNTNNNLNNNTSNTNINNINNNNR